MRKILRFSLLFHAHAEAFLSPTVAGARELTLLFFFLKKRRKLETTTTMTKCPTPPQDSPIPVIDMSRSDAHVAEELLNAFQTIGFATLVNHGVPKATLENACEQSQAFFRLDESSKLKYKFQGYMSNRGYIPVGCESHETPLPDKKETFDIGNELEKGYDNKWPMEELSDKFKSIMLTYFDSFDELHLRIMRLLAVGMKLDDEDFFVKRCNQRHENLRLLHYPSVPLPQPSNDGEPIVRGAVHTDFGTITLLTQDRVGGLRARKLNGEWVNVPPVENSIVVNVGDMLQRWSNDTLRATPHQVVDLQEANKDGIIPERFSIAFFCNANKDVTLDCLQQCSSEPPKYPPINAYDYLIRRLSETISKEAST